MYFCVYISQLLSVYTLMFVIFQLSTLMILHVRVFRGLNAFFFTVAYSCVYEHRESINGPCVIVLISDGRRTARDPHGTRL